MSRRVERNAVEPLVQDCVEQRPVTNPILRHDDRLLSSLGRSNRTAAILEGSTAAGSQDAIIDAGTFDDDDEP